MQPRPRIHTNTWSEVPSRLIPRLCQAEGCGAPMVQGNEFNQFFCTTASHPKPHEHWVPSKPAVVTVVIDPLGCLCLVRRKIPPGIGELCLPGGHVTIGNTLEQTAVIELEEEANIRASLFQLHYLGSSFEVNPSVVLVGFAMFARNDQIEEFVENDETSERIRTPFADATRDMVAFVGNWTFIQATRNCIKNGSLVRP